MKRRWHFYTNFIACTSLSIIFDDITATSILLPIMFLSWCQDFDRKQVKSHRNAIYHSIILPLIPFIYYPSAWTIMPIFTFALHCLCDIRLKKVGGFYTAKLWKYKSIGGYYTSSVWYLSNAIGGFIILAIWIMI